MGNSSQPQSLDAYMHPRLGQIKRMQQQQSAQYIEYCVGVQSERMISQWQNDCKQLREIGAEQYLFLPLSFSFDKTAMCGTGGNIDVKYEDYMFSLAPEIKNRREIKRPFRQQELWYLLFNLTQIGSILEKRDIKIGDVKPENILLNQDGEFKLISSYSWPNNPDNNQLVMEDPESKVFLSPQQCQFYNKKKGLAYPDGLDFCACEVFSMGMTVLEAGTLKDCFEGLYERSNKEWRFNQYKIRDFICIMQQRYSRQLAILIQEMLKVSPDKRIKCSTISEILKPYRAFITNIEPFNLDRVAVYEIIESANKQRSKYSSKNSLTGIIGSYANEGSKNVDREPMVHFESFENRREGSTFQQSSPRNMSSSVKSTTNSFSHSNQNQQYSHMLFSFQNQNYLPNSNFGQNVHQQNVSGNKTSQQTVQQQFNYPVLPQTQQNVPIQQYYTHQNNGVAIYQNAPLQYFDPQSGTLKIVQQPSSLYTSNYNHPAYQSAYYPNESHQTQNITNRSMIPENINHSQNNVFLSQQVGYNSNSNSFSK